MKKFLVYIRNHKGPRMDIIEDPVVMEEFLWNTFYNLRKRAMHIHDLKAELVRATSSPLSLNKCQHVLRMIREVGSIFQFRDETGKLLLATPFSDFGEFRETYYRGILLQAERAGIQLSDRSVRIMVGLGMDPIELPGLVCYHPESIATVRSTKELLLGF